MAPLTLNLPASATVLFNSLYDTKDLRLLEQDVLCVNLPAGFQIDVGWYPDHDPEGRYIVRVFRDTPDDVVLAATQEVQDAKAVVAEVERLAVELEKCVAADAGGATR